MRLLTTFLLFLLVVFVVAAAANNYGLLAVSIANGNLQLPLRKQNLGNFKLETDLDDNDDVDSNGDDYTSDGDVVSDVSADFDSDVMSDVDDVDIDDNLFNKFDTPNRLSRKPLFWNATKHLVSKLKDVKSNVMSKVQKKIRQFQLNHRDDLIDLDEMRKMRAKYGPILNKDRITGTFPAPRTTEDWKPRYNRTRRRPYNDEGGNGHHGGNRSFGSDTAAKINSNLLQQRNSHGFQHQQSSDNQQQHRQNHNQQQYRHQGYQQQSQQQQQAYQRPYQQQRYRHHTQQRPTYSFPESFTTAVATDILTTEGSRYKEPATTIRWEKSYRGRSYDAATSIGKDTDKSYSTDSSGLPTDDRIKVSTDNIYQTTRSVYTEQQIARAVLDSLLAAEGKIAKSSILSEVSTSPRVKLKTKTGLPKEHNQKRNNSLQVPTFEEKLQLQSTLATTTGTILPIKSKQSFQQNQQTSTSFTAFPAAEISVQPSEFKKQVVETSSNVVATTKMKITAGQQTSSPSQLTLKQPTSSTFNSYVLKDVKRVFHSPYQERSLNAAIVNPLLKRSPLNTSKDVPATTTSGVRYFEEDSLQLKKMKSTVKDNREDGHRRTTKIASTSSDVITSSPCSIQVNFTTTTKRGGKIRNRKRSTVVISDAEKNSSSNNVTIIRHELVTPAILVERFSTENTFPSTITSKMPLKFDNDVDIVSNAPDNRTTESDDIGHTASAATVSPISSSFTRISTDTLSSKNTYYFTVNETAVKRHHYYTGTWANSPTTDVVAASGDNVVLDIFKTTPKSPNNSPVWITTAKLPEWGLTIGPDDKRPPGVAPRLFNEAPWDNNPYNWDHRRDNKDHHDKDHHHHTKDHHHHNKDHRNRFVTRKNRAASVYDPYAVRTHKRYFTATLNPHYNADFSRQFATWRPSAPDYNNNNINDDDDDDDNNSNNNNWHPDDQITVHGLHYYPSTWYPGYEPFTRFARINTGTYSARYGGSSSKEPPPTKTNSMPSYRRTFPSWGTPLYQGRGGDKSVTKVRSKHAARFADKTHVFFTGTFNPHLRRAVVTNRVSDRPHDNAVVVSSTTTGHNFLSRLYNRIVGGSGAEATKESSTVDIYNYARPTIKTTRTIIDEAETPDPFNFVGITEKPEITSTVDFNTKGLPEVEEPTTVTIDYNTIGTSRKNKRKHHVPYHQLQAFQQQPTTSSAITGGATWSPFHATYRHTFQLPSTTSTMIGATWSPFHKFDRSIAATHRTTTTTVKVEEKSRDDDVVVTTELSSSPSSTSTEKYSVGTWSYSDYTPNPTTTAATTEITTGTIIISNKTITTAETSPVVVITAALDDDVKSSTSTAAPTAKSRKTRKPRKSTIASSDGASKSRKTRKPRKTTITSTLDDSDNATGRITTTTESPLSRTGKASSSSSSSSSKKKKSTSTVVKLQNSRKKKHHPVYPTAAIDLDFN